MKYGRVISIIFVMLSINSSYAEQIQSLSQIVTVAKQYAYEQLAGGSEVDNIRVTSGELDPRLRLARCESELVAFTPPGSKGRGNTTVGIRCDSPKPWSLYVPVRISIFEEVIITTQPIRRGQLIMEDSLKVEEIDISQTRGQPFSVLNDVIGSKAKNNLNAGTIVHSDNICLVCKGDKVTITAAANQIAVAMSGIALSGGSQGDSIRVQNSSSKRIIEAKIVSSSTVSAGS